MKNRRMLHSLTLMYKIQIKKAPNYLCDRITLQDTHGHFTRNRMNINVPFAKSKIRSMSFFIFICKKFNELPSAITRNNLSINTFRIKCRKHLLDEQQLFNFIKRFYSEIWVFYTGHTIYPYPLSSCTVLFSLFFFGSLNLFSIQ